MSDTGVAEEWCERAPMNLHSCIAIDLGTTNTLVHLAGRGIVVDEPSVVAFDRATRKVVAVGGQAAALATGEPLDREVVYPIRGGVIIDFEAAALLVQGLLGPARLSARLLRSSIMMCVSSGATWVERRAAVEAVRAGRPRSAIWLVDRPVAAGAGTGADPEGGGGVMVDIGGGMTEVALLAQGGVVRGTSLRMGGIAMDESIVHAVKRELGLVIGPKEAERLKIAVGLDGGDGGWTETYGVDPGSGALRRTNVPPALVAAACDHVLESVIEALKELLWDMPPDLARNVTVGGIRLVGGGALLRGIGPRFEDSTGIGTVIADEPLHCVVRGAASILGRGGRPEHAEAA
jgi:rod shape-determining protein MreB and related proteins